MTIRHYGLLGAAALLFQLVGCGDDDSGTPAQQHGVGSACTKDTECMEAGQTCLPFKGGYCGVAACASDLECPLGSACVTHDDGKNYCFLICTEKVQCNRSRPLELEANCSSNVTFVSGDKANKACVPPTG